MYNGNPLFFVFAPGLHMPSNTPVWNYILILVSFYVTIQAEKILHPSHKQYIDLWCSFFL